MQKGKETETPQGLINEMDEAMTSLISTEPADANVSELYEAMSQVARKRLAQRWVKTQREDRESKAKRIYYLSMEFLIGRSLVNALEATGLREAAEKAFKSVRAAGDRGCAALNDVIECEPDAALGNGGLGRLAACFLDSMATLGLPSWGYGMRYEYGMFRQSIVNGMQVESPDPWLVEGTPWEFPRFGTVYSIHFGGTLEMGENGRTRWKPSESLEARAYDYVIPGFGTERVSTMRLWKALAPSELDLSAFNSGDYARASEIKNRYENISWVLYPNDSTPAGRELRLKQEYTFVSASLQDIIAHHLREYPDLTNLADKVAIHLNDTHPAVSVAELMRLLTEEYAVPWEDAWAQCTRIFSYTNHTLMPEALETWGVPLFKKLLPKHLEIIYRINAEFLEMVGSRFPGDGGLIRDVSLIGEGNGTEESKSVRMANLSIVGSHKVNGVSRLHSNLMVETIFSGFARIWPDKFDNKTNGVTPRRWLAQADRPLAALLDRRIGTGWRLDLDELARLKPMIGDKSLSEEFLRAKRENKTALARLVHKTNGIDIDPESLFDVQVKRIHEYKRQLLNVLHVATLYNEILDGRDTVPHTVVFSGKAASSYYMAKLIVRRINDVAAVINADRRAFDRLKVVFVPNYGVSIAETIMPAADLSEQISTAGTEASGTGNMKLALNGALTIGTEDGSTIEIAEAVGRENMFLFGHSAKEIAQMREEGYDPRSIYLADARLKRVLDMIGGGYFSGGDKDRYKDIVNGLVSYGDHFMLLADYGDYIRAHAEAGALFKDRDAWAVKALQNVAGMGRFSSDRTIRDYARDTWGMEKWLKH